MSNRHKPRRQTITNRPRTPLDTTRISWHRMTVPDFLLLQEPSVAGWQAPRPDGVLRVLVAKEGEAGWHISMSHVNRNGDPGRYPTWDELADAKERFTPDDVAMGMVCPRKTDYVNMHDTCLHLWQLPEGWGA